MRRLFLFFSILLSVFLLSASSCLEVSPSNSYDLSKGSIVLIQEEYEYENSIVIPEYHVYSSRQELLLENQDYHAEYVNNNEIGTATIQINGISPYIGSISATFQIIPYQEKYTITFSSNGGSLISGEEIQTISSNEELVPPVYERKGYSFYGWSTSLSTVTSSTTIKALWLMEKYTIFLYTDIDLTEEGYTFDGEAYQTEYDVDTSTIYLPQLSLPEQTFLGWYTEDGLSKYEKIPSGSTGNISLYPLFETKLYTISFVSDLFEVEDYHYPAYEVITYPDIDLSDILSEGCDYLWYTSSSITSTIPYEFNMMPNEDLTLYGRLVETTGTGFLNAQNKAPNYTVSSFSQYLQVMDYILFYDIQTTTKIYVTYLNTTSELQAELSKAFQQSQFNNNSTISYSSYVPALGNPYTSVRISKSNRELEGTLEASSGYTTIPVKEGTFQLNKTPSTLSFPALDTSYSYECSTTDQLLYILEHRGTPVPVVGSVAEKVFQLLQRTLKEILLPTDSKMEMLQKIYAYAMYHSLYDHDVLKQTEHPWSYYDAYFMEGFFHRGIAVCDGIAKSLSAMCNMMGIPAVRVSGNGHAWNKVCIDHTWYIVDATFGSKAASSGITQFELMSYDQFCITDTKKINSGYEGVEYQNIYAYGSYDFYTMFTYSYEGKIIDHLLDSTEELIDLIAYCYTLQGTLSNISVNVKINYTVGTSFNDEVTEAISSLRLRDVVLPLNHFVTGGTKGSVVSVVFYD